MRERERERRDEDTETEREKRQRQRQRQRQSRERETERERERLESRKISSAEELETLPAGTKPRTPHHRSPGGERRGERKRSTIFLERTRKGHRQ